MPANPFERSARDRKVHALADEVWAHLTDAERLNPRLPQVLATWTNARRDTLAEAAGVRTPSAETWKQLCERLALMVERERRRAERTRRVS